MIKWPSPTLLFRSEGKYIIRNVLIGTLLVATIAITLVSFALYKTWSNAQGNLTTEQLHFFLDVYKAIGVGFLAALLGVIVPQLLPEARDRFERFKDSRVAYSEAKTSVIYLPENLSNLTFSDAATAVQDAHRKLHLAETYAELQDHLKKWHPHPEFWVEHNYWQLMAIQKTLQVNADIWQKLGTGERLKILLKAKNVVNDIFGEYCEKWVKMSKKEREQKIEEALNSLVNDLVEKNIIGGLIMTTIQEGLSITKEFIVIAKELANLPALVLPKYQSAAAALYEICQNILSANENTARWFHRFRYFDFKSPSARSDFLAAVQEYKTLRTGAGFKQLKFNCGDIRQIYCKNISSELCNWFGNSHKQEEAQGVFEKLTNADLGMVDFIQEHVLPKLDKFLEGLEREIDSNNFDEAEKLRLEFKSDTKETVKCLEEFSDDLSELVLRFTNIAKTPITIRGI